MDKRFSLSHTVVLPSLHYGLWWNYLVSLLSKNSSLFSWQ